MITIITLIRSYNHLRIDPEIINISIYQTSLHITLETIISYYILLKIHTGEKNRKSIRACESRAQILRVDPKARPTTAAIRPAANDGETAAAGEVGLGAGASAAAATEMTAARTAIVAKSIITLEKAISVS